MAGPWRTEIAVRTLALVAVLLLGAATPSLADGARRLAVARGLGDFLVESARREDGAVSWGQHEGPGAAREPERLVAVSLYAGAAGTGRFLLNLHRATRDARYLDAAKGAGLGLLRTAIPVEGGGLRWEGRTNRHDRTVPDGGGHGLYDGNAGIGLFLLDLHRETGEARFREGADGAFERILREAEVRGEGLTWGHGFLDVIGGEAGIGLALLEAHRATKDPRYLEAARKAGAHLRARATRDGEHARWEHAAYLDANFAHGAAGIATLLVALGGAEDRETARRAASWVASLAHPCEGGGCSWDYYAGPPPEGRRNWTMSSWCHGAPGTLRLFLALHRATGEAGFLERALEAGRGLVHETRLDTDSPGYLNPTLCCGACGVVDALVDLHLASGDASWLARARRLADDVEAGLRDEGGRRLYALYDDDDPGKERPYFPTGYMQGNAGIGDVLLRLALVESGRADALRPLPDHPFVAVEEADPAAPVAFPGYEALRAEAARLWPEAPAAPEAYVVLVASGSGLTRAAKALAAHRKGVVVEFDPSAPEKVLPALVRRGARHVAVVVPPSGMDVNLVRRTIVLSTLMDEDPFLDFAFGFFTGRDAAATAAFVARAIEADRKGVPPRSAQLAVSNLNHTYAGSSFLPAVEGDSTYVRLGDRAFARAALDGLEGAGFVYVGGCADPEGIWLFDDHRNLEPEKHRPFDPARVGEDPAGEMPRLTAADFRGLRLERAVVWTHACHVGSVDRMWVEGDVVSTFGTTERLESYRIPADRSVALAILASGASAYLAPLGPNHGAQAGLEVALAGEEGASLGEVMRRAYHDVVMDTEGHAEAIGLYETGRPRGWSPDAYVNHNAPQNRALYGDPRFLPLGERRSPRSVETSVALRDGDLVVTLRVARSGWLARTHYGNRGPAHPGRGRLYEVIPLPPGTTGADVGEAKATSAAGEPVPLLRTTALVERIDGRRFLHLQAVTDSEAFREAGTTLVATVRLRREGAGAR